MEKKKKKKKKEQKREKKERASDRDRKERSWSVHVLHFSLLFLYAQSTRVSRTPPHSLQIQLLLSFPLSFLSPLVKFSTERRDAFAGSCRILQAPSFLARTIPESRYLIDRRGIGTKDAFKRRGNRRARLFLMTSTPIVRPARGSISRVHRKNVRTRTYSISKGALVEREERFVRTLVS